MLHLLMFLLSVFACSAPPPVVDEVVVDAAVTHDCSAATNVCPDYAPSWKPACPAGSRCITFVNHCTKPVALAYNIGCNGDGKAGAPQCSCTDGPVLTGSGG